MNLSLHEARVIGVLLEKEVTTPDQYPLSLNALTLGCNQKSSRDPILALSETDTQAAIDSLAKKRLISEQTGFGSRVVKYKHRFCNTEFSDIQLKPDALAIICLLLLRGPQTPGELRTRSTRLHTFADVGQVEALLKQLSQQSPPFVRLLPKEAGKRESRYCELFSENAISQDTDQEKLPSSEATHEQEETLVQRVSVLEAEVAALKAMLNELIGEPSMPSSTTINEKEEV